MKKKNRELNAFSISALDLFCSAMGVFMLICFIVMNKRAEESKPIEIPPQTKVIQSLTFILSWDVKCEELSGNTATTRWHPLALGDVDMRVRYTDDKNNRKEFSPNSRIVDGYKQALYAADSIAGGADVWCAATAAPGKYEIYYVIASTYKDVNNIECYDKRFDGEVKRINIKGFRIRLKAISSGELTQSNQPDINDSSIIAEKEFEASLQPSQTPVLFATVNVDQDGNIKVTLPTSENHSNIKS